MIKLFDKVSASDGKKDGNPEKSPQPRSKSTESTRARSDQRPEKAEEDSEEQVDLINLLPDNFNEIPYLSQINVKRKSMEALNSELEQLVAKQENGQVSIKTQKDYSQIFNVVLHMLEDPNMLVFIEGIKTVEHLSRLLKSQIKQAKMKQFISLLADKYKETKTAVLAALEKTFSSIFQCKCVSPLSFFEILVNQIASSHKNPRVKQMVLDRVELIIEAHYMQDGG